MKKKALVTGISGQDGAYLSKLLLSKDYDVYGLIRRVVNRNLNNLIDLGIDQEIIYIDGDMTDECSLIHAVKTIQPNEVYNLAAQSFVAESWNTPIATSEINYLGVVKLLNAIKEHSPTSRFYQSSTSEMFGNNINSEGYQDEETPFNPRSPYAIAKLAAHWTTINYKESYGLFACCGILFNHESLLRGKEFVTRKITDGVVRIKLGLDDKIQLGNLDAKRDWGFAGDYVEAMYLMLQQSKPRNYVIATGETHSIREFLDLAFNYVGIEDWKKYVKTDPRCMRPADVFSLRGDSLKARTELGWSPRVHLPELVEMMVYFDMKRLEGQVGK